MKAKAPKIIAIFVSYYPSYLKSCLPPLKKLISHSKASSQIIIVNNNDKPINDIDDDITVIKGSNKNWEFSAWDEGVEYLTENYTHLEESTIVFLNDTFYSHRVFTQIDITLFKNAVKQVALKKIDFAGELNSFGESFEVLGVKSKGWISTYLFCISGSKVKELMPFCKVDSFYADQIKYDQQAKKLILENCSDNLTHHLESWFFPKNPKLGWYKNSSNAENSDLVKKKIVAILNEKLLFATALKFNVSIYDVYTSYLAQGYLLLRKFVYKFILCPLRNN
jgi:hypothetical protein